MFTVMGIDPGTRFLGLAAIKINTGVPRPFQLVYADTLRGDLNEFGVMNNAPHMVKAKGLTRAFHYVMDYIEPGVVCCEDNFLELNPASFKRLIEIVTMLGQAVQMSRPHVPFNLVLPRLAKQIVNADFSGSTKEDVMIGLLNSHLLDTNGFDLTKLTEHANDAILLSLYQAVQIYISYGWIIKDGKTNKLTLPHLQHAC